MCPWIYKYCQEKHKFLFQEKVTYSVYSPKFVYTITSGVPQMSVLLLFNVFISDIVGLSAPFPGLQMAEWYS